MKTLLISLLSLLALAAVVMTRRPDPVLTPYPQVFTALFNESDAAVWYEPKRMTKVYLDVPNKRARIGYDKSGARAEWLLIYRPSGGDPASPASQNYTLFAVNPDYPQFVPDNCYYAQSSATSFSSPFPYSWMQSSSNGYFVAVDSWYELPTDLVYAGSYFIEELGVVSDRWDSTSQCDLWMSGIGKVPCRSIMYTQGPNPLPLMDIRAFGARKHSYENDSYKVRVYHTFETSVKDSDFNLPDNWEVNCGNANNGFVPTPHNAASIYKNGGNINAVTIKLATPPVRSLGDVTVQLTLQPTWYYNCQDCVALGVDSLTFTADNWNVPQVVPMKYVKDGCTQFVLQATGGGYDWMYFGHDYTVITCEGNEANGCTAFPKCGN